MGLVEVILVAIPVAIAVAWLVERHAREQGRRIGAAEERQRERERQSMLEHLAWLREQEPRLRQESPEPSEVEGSNRAIRAWLTQAPWAEGLTFEEAAWVLQQRREHQDPPLWRDEILSQRRWDEDVHMILDTEGKSHIVEGKLSVEEWRQMKSDQERSIEQRLTPQEVADLKAQHGKLFKRDVQALLKRPGRGFPS